MLKRYITLFSLLFALFILFPAMPAAALDVWEPGDGESVADDIGEARMEEKSREDLSGRDQYLLKAYPTPEDYYRMAPGVDLPEA